MYSFQAAELEQPQSCSACSGELGRAWLNEVRDDTFFNVAGTWSFASCSRCGSLQLTPRPSLTAIHRAYDTYYTHAGAPAAPAATGARERLVEHWATSRIRRSALGRPAELALRLGLLPGDFRTLDKVRRPSRVLDVGCGSGSFLARARRMGHSVLGVDNDQQAVDNARRHGLACELGNVGELVADYRNQFDLVTASHVIEHVHNPRAFLQSCFELLAPGGKLWLETPNAQALGLKLFGKHWRGLEVPRHLFLFSPKALAALVRDVGFRHEQLVWSGLVSPYTFSRSRHARKATQPSGPMRILPALVAGAIALDLTRAAVGRGAQEFITMTAIKPVT